MTSDSSSDDENQDKNIKKSENGRLSNGVLKEKLIEWGSENCQLLLDCVSRAMEKYKTEHPKSTMLRKHIKWETIKNMMAEHGVVEDVDDLRLYWRRITKVVQVERSLQDILIDARAKLSKAVTPSLISPFLLFRKKEIKKYQKQDPNVKVFDLSEKIAKKWTKMSDKKKEKLVGKSEKKNAEIRAAHPDAFSDKKRKVRNNLSFKLKVSIPPANLHAFFVAKESEKEPDKKFKEKRNVIEAKWRRITGPEIHSLSKEFDTIKKAFETYKDSLVSIQRQELENYVIRRRREGMRSKKLKNTDSTEAETTTNIIEDAS